MIGMLACTSSGAIDDTDVGGLAFGAECVSGSQCATGLCTRVSPEVPLAPPERGKESFIRSVCTSACKAHGDCLAGWSCVPSTPEGESVCACVASPETCDGRDNDCNGVVDDPGQVAEPTCSRPRACIAGSCVCAATDCEGDCVDTSKDRRHCGGCGRVCPDTAACGAAACRCGDGAGVVCARRAHYQQTTCLDADTCRSSSTYGSPRISRVAVTDDALYYQISYAYHTQRGTRRIDKTTGQQGPNVFAGAATPLIVGDGATLVFAGVIDYGPGSIVGACPSADCTAKATLANDASKVVALTAFGGNAYWLEKTGDIWSCSETGCPSPAHLLVGAPANDLQGVLVADASGVYAALSDGSWYAIPNSGAPALIASGQANANGVAVDIDRIYVATDAGLTGCKKSTAPCIPTPFYIGPTRGVTADSTHVFFGASGRVVRCPRAGCPTPIPMRDIFDGAPGVSMFDVDDESIFVLDASASGRIVRYSVD